LTDGPRFFVSSITSNDITYDEKSLHFIKFAPLASIRLYMSIIFFKVVSSMRDGEDSGDSLEKLRSSTRFDASGEDIGENGEADRETEGLEEGVSLSCGSRRS
jgi:hypothetical protein